MKGKNFEIKIADLLKHTGSDTLQINNITTALLPNLTKEGICATLTLYAVDGTSILVRVQDLECAITEVCERCGKECIRKVSVNTYTAKFTLDIKESETSDEEVLLPINKKNDTIDIEELLYQVVKLQDPFVISCEDCCQLQ